jgi:diaminopimelate epimerase
MRVAFTKMHGLGNDFVVIDAVRQPIHLTSGQVEKIANRHFGIGCDQLLMVELPKGPDADFRYRIFNADGSEVAQCGNGARCFARFVREKGLTQKDVIRVETHAGHLVLQLVGETDVLVDMGIPKHDPSEIPLKAATALPIYPVDIDGVSFEFSAVSMGNPHAVLQVKDVAMAPVETLGPQLESHPLFPERVNVGFLEVVDLHRARLRVFERGSGETLACGSGACAAVVAGIERGVLESPVEVALSGGSLTINWRGRGFPVMMQGPAVTVFEGEIDL